MPSSATTNYQLSQWEASDKVLRTDFNADNAKLDAAIKAVEDKADMKANQSALNNEITARANGDSNLNTRVNAVNTALAKKGNCQIYHMSYVGDGQDTRSITFPRKPYAVFIMGASTFLMTLYGSPLLLGYAGGSSASESTVTWSGSTFTWTYRSNSYTANNGNSANITYQIIALMDASE